MERNACDLEHGPTGLAIGYAEGAHGGGTSILWTNSGDSIWTYPHEMDLNQKLFQLYKENSSRVDIFLDDKAVQVFGFNDNDQRYGDLVMQSNYWMLWGFDDGPSKMTQTGQELFVNTVHRTLRY